MRLSLPVSFLLHGGLLTWALFGFLDAKPLSKPPESQPIEVATITEDGLTRLMQGDRSAKATQTAMAPESRPSPQVKENVKTPPPPPVAAAPPPPPPPPPEPVKPDPPPPPPPKAEAPPPPPKSEPQKDEIAELALKAEAEAKAEAQRKAAEEKKRQDDARRAEEKRKRDEALKKQQEEKRKRDQEKRIADAKKAQEKKSDTFFDDMSALVSKEKPKPAGPQGGQVATNSNVRDRQAGSPEGRDRQLTGSEMGVIGSIMNEAVGRCWNPPIGNDGAGRMVIEVELKLAPNGQIVGAPKVVSTVSGPVQQAMADTVLRALSQCQPYTRLPPHLYKGGWDHLITSFDTSRMYR